MNLLKKIYKLKFFSREIEFVAIFSCLLFFPGKDSMLYYLVSAVVVLFYTLKHIISPHNIGISKFSIWLVIVNGLLLISLFFSSYHYRSLLVFGDILLYSTYFIVIFVDHRHEQEYMKYLGIMISLFSLAVFVNYLIPYSERRFLFFGSPILQGVMSGVGVLVFFHYLLRSFRWWDLGLFSINLVAVFVSESKAAFLGIVVFSLIHIAAKKRRLVAPILAFVLLSLIIPNPMRQMVMRSLHRDPYVFDRIRIWRMSLSIFQDTFPFGVGLGNFAEAARKYNFKQNKGPANFFKVPRQTHNDFMQLLAETGVAGLLIIGVLLVVVVRKWFPRPRDSLPKTLIIYLLFQAMLFNILFRLPFLFIVLFLLKLLWEQQVSFVSIGRSGKILTSFVLALVLLVAFIIPYRTEVYLNVSSRAKDPVQSFEYLNRAERINPINYRVHYRKALILSRLFALNQGLDAFETSMKYLKKVQRLNPYFAQAYMLEADLFFILLKRGIKYKGMDGEIISRLNRAEYFHPTNPFIKMRKARIYLEFGHKDHSREEAYRALSLEPDFLEAMDFLHRHFGYLHEEAKFQARKREIEQKYKRYNPRPGSYLHRILTLPIPE